VIDDGRRQGEDRPLGEGGRGPGGDGRSPGEHGRSAGGGGEGGRDPNEGLTPLARHVGSGGPPDDASLLNRFKEFKLTSLGVDHQTAIVVLFLFIVIGGVVAYRTIPKESFPEIEIPSVAVNTIYPGVSPSDMESLVTRPLEEELTTISDLRVLTSTSVEGYSSIQAEFETSVDLNEALQSVREKVDLARPELPEDSEEPSIVEFSTEEVPILRINLAGEYGLVRLKELGEELQDRLEQIPSVLRVDLRGGLEREVKVDVDLRKLQYYGVGFRQIIDAIQQENVNSPGGSVDVGSIKYLVRVDGEFPDPEVIQDLVVATVDGRPVYVRDVADVEFGFAERESFARLNGAPVVTLDVVKRSGRNIIETADEVRRVIAEMEPLFPPTTRVAITSDESDQIRQMVSSLENNIVSGLILIVGVLLFFLGLRTSVFVALSIPISMLVSFLVLGFMGVSMNMVVLFSLILALGMLVDNAIVVVENIYRYMEEGWDRVLAAKKGTGEVAMPVIAATVTTLAAFAPLLFWPGTVGEFMGFLPVTLIVTLSSSLFSALIVIPALCAIFLRLEHAPREPLTPAARWTLIGTGALGLIAVMSANALTAVLLSATAVVLWALYRFVLRPIADPFMERGLPWLLERYESSLRWVLRHRAVSLGIAGAILIGTVGLFGRFSQGIVFFPEDFPPQQILVDVDAPVGSRADFTDGIVRRLEEEVGRFEAVKRDAESVVATVGGGGGGGFMGGGPSGSDRGRVTVALIDYQDRWQDSRRILEEMQATVGSRIAGAEVTVEEQQQGPPTGPPVNVELVGEDPARLQTLSDSLIRTLERSPVAEKLVGLVSDLDQARPELKIRVDREKAALYGLSTLDVGRTVRTAIQGTEAAKYRTGNDEYDIIVRLARPYRNDLGAFEELAVPVPGGGQIPLSSVADWDVDDGFGTIRRKDMDRMATVSSDVRAGFNSNAVLAEAKEVLTPFEESLPPGYTLRYTGQQEDQAESQSFLTLAFVGALGLIALILVAQFNSVAKPLIILTSVVLSTVGVLVALLLFRMPFGIVMSGVGTISLAGIVVNNAIVMIDYIDILRERDGMDRHEALVQGGKTRFRPVLLTAITTALGLVPLAIGLNFDFFGFYGSLTPELYWGGEQAAWWGPMAIVVIVGILFATLLTLLLVPAMYSLLDDASDFVRRYFVSGGDEEKGEEDGEGRTPEGEERIEGEPVPELPGRRRSPAPEGAPA